MPNTHLEIQIDTEFKDLIPPLTAEEFAQLEKNLKADKSPDPIKVWRQLRVPSKQKYLGLAHRNGTPILCRHCTTESKLISRDGKLFCESCSGELAEMESFAFIVDGHHRKEICDRLGIIIGYTEMNFFDRNEAKVWMIDNQLGRRNLNNFVSSELALKKQQIYAQQARERMKTSTGGVNPQPIQRTGEAEKTTTDIELAKQAHVGRETIRMTRTVINEAPQEVVQAARTGDLSVTAAYHSVRPKKKRVKMPEIEEQPPETMPNPEEIDRPAPIPIEIEVKSPVLVEKPAETYISTPADPSASINNTSDLPTLYLEDFQLDPSRLGPDFLFNGQCLVVFRDGHPIARIALAQHTTLTMKIEAAA